jgi:hypothetical protein
MEKKSFGHSIMSICREVSHGHWHVLEEEKEEEEEEEEEEENEEEKKEEGKGRRLTIIIKIIINLPEHRMLN